MMSNDDMDYSKMLEAEQERRLQGWKPAQRVKLDHADYEARCDHFWRWWRPEEVRD